MNPTTPAAGGRRRIPPFALAAVALAVAEGVLVNAAFGISFLIWVAITRIGVRRFRAPLATYWPLITGSIWGVVVWRLAS